MSSFIRRKLPTLSLSLNHKPPFPFLFLFPSFPNSIPSLKPNNRSNSLQHLLRILQPIPILFIRIKVLSIIKMIIKFPESCRACWAVDIVIPDGLALKESREMRKRKRGLTCRTNGREHLERSGYRLLGYLRLPISLHCSHRYQLSAHHDQNRRTQAYPP